MVNKNKIKGSTFERELVEDLNKDIKNGSFKRVPGSGAIGTTMNEPSLTADVVGKMPGFSKRFKIECKAGYGGKEQFTIKREWLEKIKMEAGKDYSFPMLAGKFIGARNSKYFFVLEYADMLYLLDLIQDLQKEIDILYSDKRVKDDK
jgi:Holliday junction resolvase